MNMSSRFKPSMNLPYASFAQPISDDAAVTLVPLLQFPRARNLGAKLPRMLSSPKGNPKGLDKFQFLQTPQFGTQTTHEVVTYVLAL